MIAYTGLVQTTDDLAVRLRFDRAVGGDGAARLQELRDSTAVARRHVRVKQLQLWGRALSDETRLVILSLLKVYGELSATELQAALEVSHPTVSQHMRLLIVAGLVKAHKRRKWTFYRVNDGIASLLPD